MRGWHRRPLGVAMSLPWEAMRPVPEAWGGRAPGEHRTLFHFFPLPQLRLLKSGETCKIHPLSRRMSVSEAECSREMG